MEIEVEHEKTLRKTAVTFAQSPEYVDLVYGILEGIYETAWAAGFDLGLKRGVELHKKAADQ